MGEIKPLEPGEEVFKAEVKPEYSCSQFCNLNPEKGHIKLYEVKQGRPDTESFAAGSYYLIFYYSCSEGQTDCTFLKTRMELDEIKQNISEKQFTPLLHQGSLFISLSSSDCEKIDDSVTAEEPKERSESELELIAVAEKGKFC